MSNPIFLVKLQLFNVVQVAYFEVMFWDVFLRMDAEAYKTQVSWLETMAEKSRSMKRVHLGGIVCDCNNEWLSFEVVVGEVEGIYRVRLMTSDSKCLENVGILKNFVRYYIFFSQYPLCILNMH